MAGEGQPREDVTAFANGELSGTELAVVVRRHGVTHIIATEVNPANDSVLEFPRAEWLAESVPYAVYEVLP